MAPLYPPMQKTILLVSRDESLQATRALILENAGYRTVRCGSLSCAIPLATRAEMAIVGHSFTPAEQDEFFGNAHETNPSLYVLCLCFELVQPEALLKACDACFASQPGARSYAFLSRPM
jgi:hypothetical protein